MSSDNGANSNGVSPHQTRPLIKNDGITARAEKNAAPTASGRLNVRAVPQAAFMALSFGILLFALYFIGSVVIESALPSASHSSTNNKKSHPSASKNRPAKTTVGRTHIQSLESIEGNAIRGRPAGGSALDASLKKRKERNEMLIERIKTDQNDQNANYDDTNEDESSDGEEEETHFADRIRNNALALATSSWERWSRKNPPENVPQRPMPTLASDTAPSATQKKMKQTNDEKEEAVDDVVPGKSINYNLKPDLFTATISQCLLDDQCRIIYHHVGKSGGTTLEDTFFHMYPPELKSCCGPKLLGKLANDERSREKYCTAKFSSYQIIGSHVDGLVKSCMRINSDDVAATSGSKNDEHNTTANGSSKNNKGNPPRKPRSVVLTTYREPISRTLSSIHQLCNKQSNKRTNKTLEACNACRYDFGTDVWDRVVNMTNDHFEGVAEVASLQIPDVQVISLDMVDISPALDRLRERLPLDAKKLKVKDIPDVPMTQWRNPERKSVCSFAMTSEMIKSLGVAQTVYRNLTAGFL